jgi:hypothetical protein
VANKGQDRAGGQANIAAAYNNDLHCEGMILENLAAGFGGG